MKLVKIFKGQTRHAGVALYLREGDNLDTCIGVIWGRLKLPMLVYRLGWGFDTKLPLRPWSACSVEWKPRHGGYWDVCAAWCGLYAGVSFDGVASELTHGGGKE